MSQEAKILAGIGIATVLLVIGAVFFLSKPETNSAPVSMESLIRDDSNKLSSEGAKVTIVEFGDYQCPSCAAAQPVVKQLLNDYPEKVNFVYRHFPLPQHKNAMIAAEAAEAAGEQGKFWEMHELLYQNQSEWSESSEPLQMFLNYAQTLQLNSDQFKVSVESSKYQEKILKDKSDGLATGVNSTPSFYLNGVKTNSFGYTEFKQKIDASYK